MGDRAKSKTQLDGKKRESGSPSHAGSPGAGDGTSSRIVDKRSANKSLMTLEAAKLKEQLLHLVDEIVARQNREAPTAAFENFVVETGARRVLKELLGEFQVS